MIGNALSQTNILRLLPLPGQCHQRHVDSGYKGLVEMEVILLLRKLLITLLTTL